MRVLIGPVEIAGVAKGLAQGFAENGVSADLVLGDLHTFSYGGGYNSWMTRVWQAVGSRRASATGKQIFRKVFYVCLHRAIGWLVFLWSIFRYDAYIFLYGRTLTNSRVELFFLKMLGKKVIFINVGSDFRPPYMDGFVFPSVSASPDFIKMSKIIRAQKKLIRMHERYADYIISSPSSAHFHQRPFINWFSMGVPAASSTCFDAGRASDGKVKILHSPSNPVGKGSHRVCEVVEGLIAKGYPVEFIRLQGVSNQEVLRQLEDCDFVVDQLYSDIPLAVFGSEAARFARPCVVAGYMAESVSDYIRAEDVPPSFYVLPEDIESAVEKLICDTAYRLSLGKKAQEFVHRHWSFAKVARRYLDLLEDRPHVEWWSDPADIEYVGGCGAPISHVGFLVKGLIERLGREALGVGDKPALERALLDLAYGKDSTSNA